MKNNEKNLENRQCSLMYLSCLQYVVKNPLEQHFCYIDTSDVFLSTPFVLCCLNTQTTLHKTLSLSRSQNITTSDGQVFPLVT